MVYTSFRIVEGGVTLAQAMLIHAVFTLSHKLSYHSIAARMYTHLETEKTSSIEEGEKKQAQALF